MTYRATPDRRPADPATVIMGDRVAGPAPSAAADAPRGTAGESQHVWARVRAGLRQEVGENAFRSWIKPLVLLSVEGGLVRVGVPSRFVRDWVDNHYGATLRGLWSQEDPSLIRLDLIVHAADRTAPAPAAEPSSGAANGTPVPAPTDRVGFHAPAMTARLNGASGGAGGEGEETVVEPLSAPLDPRFTFDNFVVGKPNELAHAAARRVAESDTVPFNPLFLYGPVGLGKTHLMHAIGHAIRTRTPHRRVLYMSAEKFMYQFIRALRYKTTVAFKEMFRSVDVLMIDDVQFIGGKDSTQEEFFHTFNALVDQNRQVVISADKSPSDLDGLQERLRSRLGWGLVADIHPTSYELRLSILHAKRDQTPAVAIPDKVLEFLAHRVTTSVRELEGALNRLIAHAELVGRPITLESAADLLQDLIRASDRRITIDEIQRKTAEHFNIKVAEMHSARRARSVARPRQVAMFLAKQLTSRSLPEIGRKFGGRDHTTVMHAVKKIEELCGTDPSFREDVELLRRMLTH